jgi:hypothetical protein
MGRMPFGLLVVGVALTVVSGVSWSEPDSWAVYTDDNGTRVEYPRAVFSAPAVEGEQGVGHVFSSGDGRARLHVYSIPNPNGLSPSAFMRSRFPADRSVLSYDRVARNFFAISSVRTGTIIYLRCNFSAMGSTLHCIDLRYPANEKGRWDSIVTRISRSLRPMT